MASKRFMPDSGATREAENRHVLERAGYAWDDATDTWQHPRTGRTLDGRIARALTADQLGEWIRNGAPD